MSVIMVLKITAALGCVDISSSCEGRFDCRNSYKGRDTLNLRFIVSMSLEAGGIFPSQGS